MADTGYRCADDNWTTPIPPCDCGAGEWTPPAQHYSVANGGGGPVIIRQPLVDAGRDCAFWAWHKGCHKSKVHARQCAVRGCGRIFAFCERHGGDERAIRECTAHMREPHIVGVPCVT